MKALLPFMVLLAEITAVNAHEAVDCPTSDTTVAFEYHGCASVNLAQFSDPIILANDALTHEVCQAACQGYRIAALFPESCRCSNDNTAFSPLDANACDYPCMGDPEQGMCGSRCPEDGPGISTIYVTPDGKPVGRGEEGPQDPVLSSSEPVTKSSPTERSDNSQIPSLSVATSILSSATISTKVGVTSIVTATSLDTESLSTAITRETTQTSVESEEIPTSLVETETETELLPPTITGKHAEPLSPSQISMKGAALRTHCDASILGGLVFIAIVAA